MKTHLGQMFRPDLSISTPRVLSAMVLASVVLSAPAALAACGAHTSGGGTDPALACTLMAQVGGVYAPGSPGPSGPVGTPSQPGSVYTITPPGSVMPSGGAPIPTPPGSVMPS